MLISRTGGLDAASGFCAGPELRSADSEGANRGVELLFTEIRQPFSSSGILFRPVFSCPVLSCWWRVLAQPVAKLSDPRPCSSGSESASTRGCHEAFEGTSRRASSLKKACWFSLLYLRELAPETAACGVASAWLRCDSGDGCRPSMKSMKSGRKSERTLPLRCLRICRAPETAAHSKAQRLAANKMNNSRIVKSVTIASPNVSPNPVRITNIQLDLRFSASHARYDWAPAATGRARISGVS